MWTRFLPLLGNQTLSQYLSPDSIYSAQHTTHLNSHLVSHSLLSTATRRILHFSLQMVAVLHSAVHTYSYHGYKQQKLVLAQFVGACYTFVLALFMHMQPSCLLQAEVEFLPMNFRNEE